MTRTEFIAQNPLEAVLRDRGIKLVGTGEERMAVCPFHGDKNPSMSVKLSDGTWYCHSCHVGGGVIDFLAKDAKQDVVAYLKQNGINGDNHQASAPPVKPTIEKVYHYQDAIGKELFQVVRMKPKTFRQRHQGPAGEWVWNMEGVERVLYRLPEVTRSETVWIVEGEKDADNLSTLGYCATCNVGGAGKWLDGYTSALAGKDVVLCGDNDEPGRKHMEMVFESLAGKVKCARLVKIPFPHKDVSDFIEARRTEAKTELEGLLAAAVPHFKGIRLPLFTLAEIEPRYSAQSRSLDTATLDLGVWLPSIRNAVRRLIPGELVLVIGDTGTGKTAILQSIAYHSRPLPTLLFEMELPEELLYERFMAMHTRAACADIEANYKTGEQLGKMVLDKVFPNLLICSVPNLTLASLENYIVRSELKLGVKPVLVELDYVQLMSGMGKRYERVSDAAEGLKTVAKATRTIIVVASQVHRPDESKPAEVGLHSGKDSGSLENSSGLVLGITRTSKDSLELKVLKNTKGTSGFRVNCNFDGAKMRIEERAYVPKTNAHSYQSPCAD